MKQCFSWIYKYSVPITIITIAVYKSFVIKLTLNTFLEDINTTNDNNFELPVIIINDNLLFVIIITSWAWFWLSLCCYPRHHQPGSDCYYVEYSASNGSPWQYNMAKELKRKKNITSANQQAVEGHRCYKNEKLWIKTNFFFFW